MTYTEMTDDVSNLCNVSGDEAINRIGRSLNERYLEVCSRIGVDHQIVRTTATKAVTIGNRYVVFGTTAAPVTDVLDVYDATTPTVPRLLHEVAFALLRDSVAMSTDTPAEYAVSAAGAFTVTIFLDSTPGTAYVLSADVLTTAVRLSGHLIPAFNEKYHNILTHYAKSVEYEKKTDSANSKKHADISDKRLSELAYKMSVNKRLRQGDNRSSRSRRIPVVVG